MSNEDLIKDESVAEGHDDDGDSWEGCGEDDDGGGAGLAEEAVPPHQVQPAVTSAETAAVCWGS